VYILFRTENVIYLINR